MNKKYVENMLMIETITSLLKAHGEDTSSSYSQEEVNEERVDEIIPVIGALAVRLQERQLVLLQKRQLAQLAVRHPMQ